MLNRSILSDEEIELEEKQEALKQKILTGLGISPLAHNQYRFHKRERSTGIVIEKICEEKPNKLCCIIL